MLMMSFVQNSNWRKPFFEGGGQSLWGGGKPHETWFVNFSVNFFEALKAASKMSVLYDAFFDIYEGIPKVMKTTDVSRDFGAEQFDSFVFFFVTSSYPIGSIPSLKLTTNAPWKWWKSQVRNLPLPGGPHFQGIIGRSEKVGLSGVQEATPSIYFMNGRCDLRLLWLNGWMKTYIIFRPVRDFPVFGGGSFMFQMLFYLKVLGLVGLYSLVVLSWESIRVLSSQEKTPASGVYETHHWNPLMIPPP